MNSRLTVIKEDRLRKLKELKDQGINPYPSRSNRKQTIREARELMGKDVNITGRLLAVREHGKIAFSDLKDETGEIQLLFRKDQLGEKYDVLKLLDYGDFLEVLGDVTKTKAGETTVDVKKYTVLTKSLRPIPDSWHGFKDVEERFRRRYVDLLINPDVRKIFETRAKIIMLLRNYLDDHGFLEVTTPVLQPIYGGTTALPFTTHHNALDADLYLRIADELYLKRLIVGGYEKVYEIGTDFRNEGISRWHNPEFTQLEFYQAYADYRDLMVMTENMLSGIVKEITGSYEVAYGETTIDFKPPWRRVSYYDAIKDATGIDVNDITLEQLKKEIREKKLTIAFKESPDVPALLDAIIKTAVRPNITNPTFFVDYPAFMRPLAKQKPDDPRKVEAFQLIVAGTELLNAYSELNDPIEQRKRWEAEERREKEGVAEHQVVDEDYIRALEYGMPPTAGWGMGIERFTAILTNSHSIKEVILFPTLRPTGSLKTINKMTQPKNISGVISHISADVHEKLPGIKFAVVRVDSVTVVKKSDELEAYKKEVLEKFSGLTLEKIDSMPTIQAYRNLFRAFGVDWHSRRPSPDALLRRIALGKGLYTVNTLVDAYNLAVVETGIGLGAFDSSKLSLPVVLRFAKDGEQMHPIGEEKPIIIQDGELVYADQEQVITLDLNYRDTNRTKITEKSKDILLFADGAEGITDEEVMEGLEKGIEYITRFCGGKIKEKQLVR